MFPEFIVIPAYVPRSGFVKATLVEFASYYRSDGRVVPRPVNGYATFTPSVGEMQWPGLVDPVIGVASRVRVPIVDGVLRRQDWDPDVDDPSELAGVYLAAADQPEALPDKVQWSVSFQLDGVTQQPRTRRFEVDEFATLDLATIVVDTPPAPGTVTIVSAEDRIRAEQAADLAEGFAEDAETALNQAVTAKNLAEGFAGVASAKAEEAESSAVAAATAKTQAEAARDTAVSAGIKWKTVGGKLRPYVTVP